MYGESLLKYTKRRCLNDATARGQATLGYYRGYDLLPRDDPTLARMRGMLDAARERPAFQATSQDADFYVRSYKGYGKEKASEKLVVAEAARL